MKERIKHVMARTFDIPVGEIPDDAQINTVSNWDSLGHMILMLELESEFGVTISTEDMTSLLSLELLDAYLEANGRPAGPGVVDRPG